MSCMSMQLLALASSQRVYGRLASLRTSVPQFRRFSSAATTRLNRVPKPRSLTVRMVLTESQDLAVGTVAPDFALPEPLTGKTVKLSEYAAGAPLLLMFICNHCPFVVWLKPAIVELAKEYQAKGFKVLAVSSNSVQTHPQDGPEEMAKDAQKLGYTFPYLYDETQEVAKAYKAACTPEFLVFDAAHKLVYHGQFDDSRPRGPASSIPVTGTDLRSAMDDVLAGRPLSRPVKRSIGCNIKWHPDSAPEWFN